MDYEERLLAVERTLGWLQGDIAKERTNRALLEVRINGLEQTEGHDGRAIQGSFKPTPSGKFIVAPGWDQVGRTGVCFGSFWVGQWWAVVLWDAEEDPGIYKLSGLQFGPEIPMRNT